VFHRTGCWYSVPLCQSPESTKVLQTKKIKADQGLFSQELCGTAGFTDKEDGIHQGEMHFNHVLCAKPSSSQERIKEILKDARRR